MLSLIQAYRDLDNLELFMISKCRKFEHVFIRPMDIYQHIRLSNKNPTCGLTILLRIVEGRNSLKLLFCRLGSTLCTLFTGCPQFAKTMIDRQFKRIQLNHYWVKIHKHRFVISIQPVGYTTAVVLTSKR